MNKEHFTKKENFYLKLGLEHKFGVLKSGSLFSAPPTSFLGDSWLKLNFLGKVLWPPNLGESASMRSTQDWATMAREVSGVVRP